MNPLAIAVQGIGFGPVFTAFQGFVQTTLPLIYEKYVSTVYRLNSFNVIYQIVDKNIIYKVKSSSEIDL